MIFIVIDVHLMDPPSRRRPRHPPTSLDDPAALVDFVNLAVPVLRRCRAAVLPCCPRN